MAIEQLMQAVLTATPAKRRELERVLCGEARTETSGKADENQNRRLVSFSGAARLLALGRNSIYRLVRSGRLDAVELNGARKITMRSVDEFISGARPPTEGTAALIAESKARYAAEKSDGEEAK